MVFWYFAAACVGFSLTCCFLISISVRFRASPRPKRRVIQRFRFVDNWDNEVAAITTNTSKVSDSKFDELCDLVIASFVTPWYQHVTNSPLLPIHIKLLMSRLIQRLKVDNVENIIGNVTDSFQQEISKYKASKQPLSEACKADELHHLRVQVSRVMQAMPSDSKLEKTLMLEVLSAALSIAIDAISEGDFYNMMIVKFLGGARDEGRELKAILGETFKAQSAIADDYVNNNGEDEDDGDDGDDGDDDDDDDDDDEDVDGDESDVDGTPGTSHKDINALPLETEIPNQITIKSTLSENKSVWFIIEASTESKSGWIFARRYSQFRKLHNYLQKKYRLQVQLPKSVFQTSIEARRSQLELYLRRLIGLEPLQHDRVFKKFISQQSLTSHFTKTLNLRPMFDSKFIFVVETIVLRLLKSRLSQFDAEKCVQILKDSLFEGGKLKAVQERTEAQKLFTQREARELLDSFMSETCSLVFGAEKTAEASAFIFELLQNEKLNKRLLLNALDQFVNEIVR